ncbi:MAG: RibD family protein [Chloroflexia bacterium]
MNDLTPLTTLFDEAQGGEVDLPAELAALYGRLVMPAHEGQLQVIGNFVTTLDGVVDLGVAGKAGGAQISGHNRHDRAVMGLLRSIAGAVVVGAGTLRSVPGHLWTADYIYAPLTDAYRALRASLGETQQPLNVIVSERGDVQPTMRVFRGEVPVLVVTTPAGARAMHGRGMPEAVQIAEVASEGALSAGSVMEVVNRVRPSRVVLVEGGPHLMGDFLAEKLLDELFLTLAPQVAGRDEGSERPGFVVGKTFAPERPVWGDLVSARRAGSHLFLRYSF